MLTSSAIPGYNSLFLTRLSQYMNQCPEGITLSMLQETMAACSMDEEEAYRVLLAGALDLYDHRDIRRFYLPFSVKKLEPAVYEADPYYRHILPSGSPIEGQLEGWELRTLRCQPCELFAAGDLKQLPDRRILPQLGFFLRSYSYPCLFQDGREWMMITPNEVETMKSPLSKARGHVLTYGLGLGYFAFMALQRPEVKTVTVVEKDPAVLSLFQKRLLPRFGRDAERLCLIQADALAYAEDRKKEDISPYDFVFADIWHDPSDGVPLYRKLKALERSDTVYAYWIEDTLRCYL